MLPKPNRIKNKKDFELIFKKGKSFKGSIFILKTLENNLGLSRFGFVISQKVSKKATVRNKIRRRFSAVLEKNMGNIKNNIDSVLIALPDAAKKDFPETKDLLINLLGRAKIISEK